MSTITPEKLKELHLPFPSNRISWKPGAVDIGKTMAQALPYVDNRVIQDRLDEVVGAENWQTEYVEVVGQGRLIAVRCTLSINVGGSWIKKADAAPPSQIGPDENLGADVAVKGAYSDAMKRAAVHWGLGRYLYDYNPPMVAIDERMQIVIPPALPKHMLPEGDIALSSAVEEASSPVAGPAATSSQVVGTSESSQAPEASVSVKEEKPAVETPRVNAVASAEETSGDAPLLDVRKSDEENIANLIDKDKKIAGQFLVRIANPEAHQRMFDYLDGPAAESTLAVATRKFLKERLEVERVVTEFADPTKHQKISEYLSGVEAQEKFSKTTLQYLKERLEAAIR